MKLTVKFLAILLTAKINKYINLVDALFHIVPVAEKSI
jgi:hypothetical protein